MGSKMSTISLARQVDNPLNAPIVSNKKKIKAVISMKNSRPPNNTKCSTSKINFKSFDLMNKRIDKNKTSL